MTQIRIKYVVLVRPHVLVRISQSNTRSNTVQIHQIRTVLHRISTFRLLLLGDTSDDSVPPLYMSTDTREYCINMPYSSTCQIRIKYTSNTQSNTRKYGCTWRTTPVGWVHVKYASNTQSNTRKYGCIWRTTLVGWVHVKYASNTQANTSKYQIRKQIQLNMGVLGGGLSTHQMCIKYASKYEQTWV